MAKDLLQDRFGRFYEIPRVLAQSGHEVHGVCLKYWPANTDRPIPRPCEFVDWSSFSLGRNWPLGFFEHYQRLDQISARIKPDIVVGASDCAHVVMAAWLAAKFGVPYAVDLYDNFESYRTTQIPGMKQLLRRAVRKAAAVSVVSETLLAKVREEYQPTGVLRTITNAIAPELFHAADKTTARRCLGLPEAETLIGTAGSLTRARGIETLYRAFDRLSKTKPNLSLVLAGPTDEWSAWQLGSRIIHLGELSHERVGNLFNALDVGIICNRDDEFGRYCFPQKLFEMLACGLPLVAADVGAMRGLLPGYERYLFAPGSAASLADAIVAQLETRYLPAAAIPTWQDCGLMFENLLEAAVAPSAPSLSRIDAVHLGADVL